MPHASDSRKLEASDDGVNFKFVCIIPPGAILQQTHCHTCNHCKIFSCYGKKSAAELQCIGCNGLDLDEKPVHDPGGTEIAEIVLHSADRINMFEEKDAFAPVGDLNTKMTKASNDVVATNDIIDLTDKMNADGSLNWTAPSGGDWKVVRFGYSLLGID